MPTVDISQFEDVIVIHFGIEGSRINAYTLASSLVSIADAAKNANAAINFGYDIEVVVEALGGGSFRAKIRAIYTEAQNLFSRTAVQAVVLSVLANYIYERTLSVDREVKITTSEKMVVIEQGDTKIIVPRDVYEAKKLVENNPSFRESVSRTFEAVKRDPKIESIGIVKEMTDSPTVIVGREQFPILAAPAEVPERVRTITEEAELIIVKAILKKSKRKWEFVWRGNVISAPVLDDEFYAKFSAHDITIAPGDTLNTTLAITQQYRPEIGTFTNLSYQVVKVHRHNPRPRQMPLGTQEREAN